MFYWKLQNSIEGDKRGLNKQRGMSFWILTLNKYFWNTYYVLGLLRAEDMELNETDKNPCPRGVYPLLWIIE